jgi:TRAP transporter 4TM/12TM fusion protein
MSTETSTLVPKYRPLKGVNRAYVILASTVAMAAAIFYNFYLSIGSWTFPSNGYLYFLLCLYLPMVFLLFPPVKTIKAVSKVPWYDYLIVLAILVSTLYCFFNAIKMRSMGWEIIAPWPAKIACLIIFLSVLEGARRVTGMAFFIIILFFATYALYSQHMPSFLNGKSYPFWRVVTFHVMGPESIIGLPMRTTGSILIGYMIFAVALMHTGAGNFFLDIAQSMLGTVRGGAAKVSILSSAFMGSISGSVISNVLSTGSFTIPAMKRSGYPAYFAGAVEACASAGGTMMPPIMGATAFVMAEMLQVPYLTIIKAAIIPSILYFACLLFQADAYAALHGIKGQPKSECPSFWSVLKDGWLYLFSIFILIYMVVFMSMESQAAWVATGVLLVVSSFKKSTRLSWSKFLDFLEGTAKFMTEITSLLAACGLIVGAMVFTGIATTFASEVVGLAGNSIFLILVLGAFSSFILGMGMTITACYIFLAIVMAPALINMGFDPLAVHLFVLYWGMASYITPPVALGAFAAATIAGSSPMKTGMQAMRLGVAKYFLPFFFVLNPALIFKGPWEIILQSFITCLVGLALIGAALEGYLQFIGKINFATRTFIFAGGVLLGVPTTITDLYGIVTVLVGLLVWYFTDKNRKEGTHLGRIDQRA